MRKTKDRIRHAISFEIIALCTITPLGAWVFGFPMVEIGVLAIVGASIAMAWNYVYNLIFDHALLRIAGDTRKSLATRVIHTILFEVGLLIALIPFIAWYLDIALVDAFLMDVAFTLFFLVYAFVFNWAYDLIYPIPETAIGMDAASHDRNGETGVGRRSRGSAAPRA